MTNSQQFKIYQIMEPVVGKEKAIKFIKQIEELVDKKFESNCFSLATKEDLVNLKTDLTNSIFWAGLMQYLAIISTLIGLLVLFK